MQFRWVSLTLYNSRWNMDWQFHIRDEAEVQAVGRKRIKESQKEFHLQKKSWLQFPGILVMWWLEKGRTITEAYTLLYCSNGRLLFRPNIQGISIERTILIYNKNFTKIFVRSRAFRTTLVIYNNVLFSCIYKNVFIVTPLKVLSTLLSSTVIFYKKTAPTCS